MTLADGVLDPPTEEQREIARREMERRRKISESQRGRPKSQQLRERISESNKRTWAEKQAAVEAVMREVQAQEAAAANALHE